MHNLVGNVVARRNLAVKLGNSTLPNKLFFYGQPGTGKSTLAKYVAQSLTCKFPIDGLACEKCSHCANPTNIKIFNMGRRTKNEDIETVIQEIFDFKASSLHKTVFIIEEIQQIVPIERQAAFLVEFDRLQDSVYVILCATKKIYPDLASRCYTLNITTPTLLECRELINEINPNVDVMMADLIIKNCRYVPRDIITIVNNCEMTDDINKDIAEYFGYNSEVMLEFFYNLFTDSGTFYRFIERMNDSGVSISNIIENLPHFYLSILAYKVGKDFKIFTQAMKVKINKIFEEVTDKQLFSLAAVISGIKSEGNPELECINLFHRYHSKSIKNNSDAANRVVIENIVASEEQDKIQSLNEVDDMNLEDFTSYFQKDALIIKDALLNEDKEE